MKSAAADAAPSAASTARSSAVGVGLDAAVQRRRREARRRRDAARDRRDGRSRARSMTRQACRAVSGTHACRARDERQHHRVLAAVAELRAGAAVGHDLLRQPDVRHDREAQLDEVCRRVRERAQRLEAGDRGARARARRTSRRPTPQDCARRRLTTSERTSATVRLSGASSAQPTTRSPLRPRRRSDARATAISSRSRGRRWPSARCSSISAMNRVRRRPPWRRAASMAG